MKTRKAFVMQLNRGCEEEYHKRHDPIWPELARTLKEHGVSNYSIHLHPETGQLFAYAEIEDEHRWKAIAETDVCRRWWRHMAPLMPSHVDGSPKSVVLEEVFHLP